MHPNRFGSGNATRSWPVNHQAQHATGLGGVRCYRMPSHRCPLCAIGVQLSVCEHFAQAM